MLSKEATLIGKDIQKNKECAIDIIAVYLQNLQAFSYYEPELPLGIGLFTGNPLLTIAFRLLGIPQCFWSTLPEQIDDLLPNNGKNISLDAGRILARQFTESSVLGRIQETKYLSAHTNGRKD